MGSSTSAGTLLTALGTCGRGGGSAGAGEQVHWCWRAGRQVGRQEGQAALAAMCAATLQAVPAGSAGGRRPHLQVEGGHRLVLRCLQLAAVDGVHDGAGVAQLEAVAHAVRAARPACRAGRAGRVGRQRDRSRSVRGGKPCAATSKDTCEDRQQRLKVSPVLMSQTWAPCFSTFSASMDAYLVCKPRWGECG